MNYQTNLNQKSKRNVYALGFVSFFTDLSTEMVLSLLPIFILSLPGANTVLLGLIEGIAEALSYGMRAISGVFSDKLRKRKTIVLLGYGLSNITKPLFSVVNSAYEALTIRIFDRVGKGIRTSPRDALICDSVIDKTRGFAFGLHRTLDQSGAIAGPLIASTALITLGFTVRDVFGLSIIPGLAALLILFFFVEEQTCRTEEKLTLLKDAKKIFRGDFLRLLLLISVFSLGAFNFSFILLFGAEAGISNEFIPVLFALVNVAHVSVAIPAGLLADRLGREKMLFVGYSVFFAGTLTMFIGQSSFFVALFVAVFFGLYQGIVNTVTRAMIPKYVKSNFVGTAYGLYYLITGFSFLFANIIVGLLWHSFGSKLSVLYSIILTIIALFGFVLFRYLKSKSNLR